MGFQPLADLARLPQNKLPRCDRWGNPIIYKTNRETYVCSECATEMEADQPDAWEFPVAFASKETEGGYCDSCEEPRI